MNIIRALWVRDIGFEAGAETRQSFSCASRDNRFSESEFFDEPNATLDCFPVYRRAFLDEIVPRRVTTTAHANNDSFVISLRMINV